MSDLVISEINNGCATLTLNNPAQKNVLNMELLQELQSRLQKITSDKTIRLLQLTATGNEVFSDGSDISVIDGLSSRDVEDYIRLGQSVLNTINRADLISVAVINGNALGSGLELALSCDIRLAADHARFGFPEVEMGLVPFFGGTQRLTRMIGLGRTFEMILSARELTAQDALDLHLVNHTYKSSELQNEADALLERLLQDKDFAAQKMARWLIHSSLDLPISAGLEREIITFTEIFNSQDAKAAMKRYRERKGY